ncbi:hypothetical protein SAMN04487949_1883 [Halogranum gelatinilyticum]|uniref:Uncharacterized protein n=1 Tax=Halogranum gelatinilyticum TaxID=660521 RepID=A0A1G9TRV9_9EURY|nr:hypothetical protein [Halogranum gelatinilyticum]SDM50392.1 hypothetical protein SAMN04487949_1883 [Halogranum gelatinilyticum]
MSRIEQTRTELVNRLVIVMAAGFSTVTYGLDVLTDGAVGVVFAAPALLALAVVAYDKYLASKDIDDLPDGVVMVDE